MPDTRVRLTRWTIGLLAGAVVLVVIAIGWLVTEHVKHGLLFLGLAAVCVIGAWFTSNPSEN
jgi:uncharacterized membrane protein YccC